MFFCKDIETKCLNGWSDSEFLTAFMELVVMEMTAYGTDADIPMALRLYFLVGEQALVFFIDLMELSLTYQ